MRTRHRGLRNCGGLLAALLVPWVLGLAAPARADEATRARFHDARARALYDKGDYDGALDEFFQSEQAAPNPRTAFNIALCLQRLRRAADAFSYFTEYVASDDSDAGRRAYASEAVASLAKDIARIEVATVPPGAQVFVDRRELGSYGTTPRVIPVDPGEHRIWVQLDGYRPAEATVRVGKGELAQAKLEPVRILGKLVVRSPVAGEVTVRAPDGTVAARGAAPLSAEVPPGAYEVGVEAAGHAPWRALAQVRADQAAEAVAAPEPLPTPTGDLTVTSNVTGALVRLDGQPAGFSPMVLSSLPAGRHPLAIERSGLVPWRGTLTVEPGERTWVTATLEEPAQQVRSPATWVAGGLGAASLLAAGVVGIFALTTHDEFESTGEASVRERGIALNTATDVLLVTGVVGLGTSVVLYFATERQSGRPSAVTVSRSPR